MWNEGERKKVQTNNKKLKGPVPSKTPKILSSAQSLGEQKIRWPTDFYCMEKKHIFFFAVQERNPCKFAMTLKWNVQICVTMQQILYCSSPSKIFLAKARKLTSFQYYSQLKPVPSFTSLCSERNVFFMTLTVLLSLRWVTSGDGLK